ncbi:MAG: sigma-70 family RNA polymerase sigma factor [bacterium]|nr:sigma-70 family RNA polymerase sigma factor [bacterium]
MASLYGFPWGGLQTARRGPCLRYPCLREWGVGWPENRRYFSAGRVLVAESSQEQVTQILQSAGRKDPGAANELLPLVYEELRRLAQKQMAHEPPGQTIQATALVHEAYLRLVGSQNLGWDSRAHFFAAAARAMRRILVDRARRRQAVKHGGDRRRVDLEPAEVACDDSTFIGAEQLVALDEALDGLERVDARKARIVMLRYFAGLTIRETAKALDLSGTTVKDEWQFARAWLYSEMAR